MRRGREPRKVMLPDRFQEADRPRRDARRQGQPDLYLGEWRRSAATPCSDDIEREAATEAARIERPHTDEDLERLVRAQGLAEASA